MIAIKDMEMPECCADCNMLIENYPYLSCSVTGSITDDYTQKKMENCPLVEIGTCKDCKHWKDSDGVYRRGFMAESKCPINISRVLEGNFYCADFERRGSENR